MIINYNHIENLSSWQRNTILVLDIFILLVMYLILSYYTMREKARQQRIQEEINQNRERIAEHKRQEKEKCEKEQNEQRRRFFTCKEFQDLRDMIFLDPVFPRQMELTEYGLFLYYDGAEWPEILDWDKLPVSKVKKDHLKLANEALAVLCQEKDQRYGVHYISEQCAEIVLNHLKYIAVTDF